MISDDKLKHMLGVARRCRDIAESKHLPESLQNACFVMGFLHDIGYELCNEHDGPKKHPERSKEMLTAFLRHHKDIINAISKHGSAYHGLNMFDKILNEADLTIDYQGNVVDVNQRLADIKNNCTDINKFQYNQAVRQAQSLFLIEQDDSAESEESTETANSSYTYYASHVPDHNDIDKTNHNNHTHASEPNDGKMQNQQTNVLHNTNQSKMQSDTTTEPTGTAEFDNNFNPLYIDTMNVDADI